MAVRLSGWDRFLKALDRERARRMLNTEIGRSMRRAVLLLRTEVISYVDSEKHGIPNAPLTVLIKGSSRPLVDRGDLRMGITTDVAARGRRIIGAVGVLRTRRAKNGKPLFNVAKALHEGYTLRVTPRMRRAIFAELSKRQGKKAKTTATGEGAGTYRVRGRPFIRVPYETAQQRIVEILGGGVRVTFKNL